MPTTHVLKAELDTLHGRFSREIPPVLTIDPGDSVHFQCIEAGWKVEPFTKEGIYDRAEFPGRNHILDSGHALSGPVHIRGAKPGTTLAVRINHLRPGTWGSTYAGGWVSDWNERLGITTDGIIHRWVLEPDTLIGRNQHGHTVKLNPFMGVYGMPPAEPGNHPTPPPRRTGGNIDCKELIAGSTLYLPVEVEGGLFSVGDGHAAQGDGEVSVTAIECPMDQVDLTFDVIEDMPLDTPVANTPVGWLALGFHQDLDEAAAIALEQMLMLMNRLYGLAKLDALALASVTVDLRITQIVNGVRGVHAVLPHGAIGRSNNKA